MRSASASIWPEAKRRRASASSVGRRKLPTMSARNGGVDTLATVADAFPRRETPRHGRTPASEHILHEVRAEDAERVVDAEAVRDRQVVEADDERVRHPGSRT